MVLPQFHLSTVNFPYLKVQGSWAKTLCDNHVTRTYRYIQCYPRVFHMHDELFGNRHVKDISNVTCSKKFEVFFNLNPNV
jgi:hypothetical protein